MANLVVCCDGTWKTPDDKEDGVPLVTNVVKLYNIVAALDDDGGEQKKYYHPGVGTDGGRIGKLLGGGLGVGLNDNIKGGYKWLATNFRPGDHIYLFGFSRGAYTVRSLAGMIACSGLVDLTGDDLNDHDIWHAVDEVFEAYRKRPASRDAASDFKPEQFGDIPDIHFLGVWDTVGALGIPDELTLLNLLDDADNYKFHDTELSDRVRHARHAVAIDEMRESYSPTLWTNVDNRQGVKQAWFAGVHSDVGGGYLEKGLSDAALKWMVDEARACGLSFRGGLDGQIAPDPRDVLHDSRSGFFKRMRAMPRTIPCFGVEGPESSFIHNSAIARHRNPPIVDADYWPTLLVEDAPRTCSVFARQQWNATGIYLHAGHEYEFRASGEWVDSSIKSGPGGTQDGNFQVGEIGHIAGSIWGAAENLFKTVSGEEEADFWWTRRHEEWPWFALVGAIANGAGAKDKRGPRKPQTFLIGEGCTFTPKADGYLYCYANDAWHMYGNNKGSVRLEVKRLD